MNEALQKKLAKAVAEVAKLQEQVSNYSMELENSEAWDRSKREKLQAKAEELDTALTMACEERDQYHNENEALKAEVDKHERAMATIAEFCTDEGLNVMQMAEKVEALKAAGNALMKKHWDTYSSDNLYDWKEYWAWRKLVRKE